MSDKILRVSNIDAMVNTMKAHVKTELNYTNEEIKNLAGDKVNELIADGTIQTQITDKSINANEKIVDGTITKELLDDNIKLGISEENIKNLAGDKVNELINSGELQSQIITDKSINANEKIVDGTITKELLDDNIKLEISEENIKNLAEEKVNELVSSGTLQSQIITDKSINANEKIVDGTITKELLDDNIKLKLTEISSQLDNKASKNELEVERKRIDNFTKLTEGSTTGDAELIDGRIGADGIVYETLGRAIREQINDKLDYSEFKLLLGENPTLLNGYWLYNNGVFKESGSFKATNKIKHNKVPKIEGAIPHSICFYNSDKFLANKTFDSEGQLTDIPTNFTHFTINFEVSANKQGFENLVLYFDNKLYDIATVQVENTNDIDKLKRKNEQLIDVVNNIKNNQDYEVNKIQYSTEDGYIVLNGNFTSNAGWKTTEYIELDNSFDYYITTNVSNASIGVPYIFDENKSYLGYLWLSDGNTTNKKIDYIEKFPNAKYLRCSYHNANTCTIIKKALANKNNTIYCVPVYGQSNAKGYSSYPAITTDSIFPNDLLDENLRMLTERLPAANSEDRKMIVESSCSGTGEQFLRDYYINNDNRNIRFASFKMGIGGCKITQLVKGTGQYNNVINYIKNIVNISNVKGDKVVVPAFCYVQGESDCSEQIEGWKEKLIQMQIDFETDIKAITGQTEPVLCCIYNLGWLPDNDVDKNSFDYPYMNICTAQMELVRDNDKFIMSSPSYALLYNDWDRIHLSNIGQKLLGTYQGHSIYESVVNKSLYKGVYPKNVSIEDNNIKILYNVPTKPLMFDTTLISSVENYGFSVINSNNENIVTNVRIDGEDTVIISCSKSPIGCKLRYGCNGTTSTGRTSGCRGNLRDCQGYFIQKNILSKNYQIHNWGLMFEQILS